MLVLRSPNDLRHDGPAVRDVVHDALRFGVAVAGLTRHLVAQSRRSPLSSVSRA